MAHAAMSEYNVFATIQLAEELPHVSRDRVQLQLVILNLIISAIEAMNELREGSRELSISTNKAESDGVLVALGESGPGLPVENLLHIFETFDTTKFSALGMA